MVLCLISIPTPSLYARPPSTITIGLEDTPTSIFPFIVTGSLSGQISAQLFASLCRLTTSGELEPYLAEEFTYSKNYTTLTLTLRKDAFFHDGTPITAKDVVFSLRTAKKLHLFSVVFSPIKSIRSVNEHVVTITFAYPQPHFLKICIPSLLPIIPQHVYQQTTDFKNITIDSVIGSGPFKVASVTPSKIVLKKFEKFFIEGRPYLDGITFAIYNNVGDSYYRHVAQELDISAFRWDYAPKQLVSKYSYLKIKTQEYQHIKPYFVLQFNLNRPPFDNILVRKALTLAIDRNFLAKNGLGQHSGAASIPMNSPLPPSSPYHSTPSYPYGYNVDLANKLLDAAGYPRNEVGMRMKIEVSIPPYINKTFMLVEYLQYIFAHTLGVEVVINSSKQTPEWEKRIGSGNYQVTIDELFGWHDPSVGIHRLYASTNRHHNRPWTNTIGLTDPTVDALLQQAASAVDTETRKAIYKKLQKHLGEQYISAWIATAPYTTIYNTRVHGLDDLYLGTMSPMDNVHVTTSAPQKVQENQ